MDTKTKAWLNAESEMWVADNIITQEQCLAIQNRYPITKTGNPLLVFFAIIGAVLIGAGIILVFATNWWNLPMELRIMLAFFPLLLAQGICLYTWCKRYGSVSFREGSAVFLSLSFFAALGLIGQIFHTPSDLSAYLLVCALFTLPGVYLFSSKAAMTIYVLTCLCTAWSLTWWYLFALTLFSLPYFYREIKHFSDRRGMNYLLFLLSLMVLGSVASLFGFTVIWGLSLLLIDAWFHKIASVYFFTSAKFLSISFLTADLLVTSIFMGFGNNPGTVEYLLVIVIAVAYVLLRRSVSAKLAATDLIFASGVVLSLAAPVAGIAACLLSVGLGIFFIVYGSRNLALKKLNYGMVIIVWSILIRFFDAALGLFVRGIVFIMLGLAFLGINLYVSRKRRRTQP